MNKILIIEDEISLRQILETKLTKAGFAVKAAKNGDQGILMAKEIRPDLILLDIIMPQKNGLDVLKEIKANVSLLSVPVVILTNLLDDSTMEEAKKLGAIDYLVKSNLKIEEIIIKINNILGKK